MAKIRVLIKVVAVLVYLELALQILCFMTVWAMARHEL